MKITRMDRQSAEFYYKILHDYLNNNLSISMGNSKVQKFCDNCGEKENVKHLLYQCSNSNFKWQTKSKILLILKVDGIFSLLVFMKTQSF